MAGFACGACGSPSIAPPPAFAEESVILCGGCGRALGTWAEFRQAARRAILAESPTGAAAALSSDPLSPPTAGFPLPGPAGGR